MARCMIYRAVREALPVTAGMLVIMIVFLPLLSLQGLEGKLFAPVALTIIFALGASLLCSLTVIPVLASLLMGSHQHATPKLVAYLEQVYARWLQRAMAAEKQVLAAGCRIAAGCRAVHGGGQILYAHAGRGRHHHADREAAFRQSGRIGPAGWRNPARHTGRSTRCAAHRGAGRLR
jgi:hypothetical protein